MTHTLAAAHILYRAARRIRGPDHPATTAAAGRLDAVLGLRPVDETASSPGFVAWTRERGQAGYHNRGARRAHDRKLAAQREAMRGVAFEHHPCRRLLRGPLTVQVGALTITLSEQPR